MIAPLDADARDDEEAVAGREIVEAVMASWRANCATAANASVTPPSATVKLF